MKTFRLTDTSAYVDAYAVEVYLPEDYGEKAYRGMNYYEVAGTKVRYFGVGNMRFFENQKQMESPNDIPVYTLGIPMIITSIPSEIDVRDVVMFKGGVSRKCIVLTFYRDDTFMESIKLIQSSSNLMMLLSRIESGKLNHMMPDEAAQILADAQTLNNMKLKLPSEEEELLIAERYRTSKSMDRARMKKSDNPDDLISLNMRQEGMATTTYQAVSNEDINTSLIVSVNRANKGIVDKPGAVESIVRGLEGPIDELVKERDERLQVDATQK